MKQQWEYDDLTPIGLTQGPVNIRLYDTEHKHLYYELWVFDRDQEQWIFEADGETNVPISATTEQREAVFERMMKIAYKPITSGKPGRRLASEFSRLSLEKGRGEK